ncbi:spastin [Trifolium pratense]|uniref:Spastin n=1 Tax=Trifolium pratense TaxID=57577 RepID=A0A2K3NMW0_TRIPR|nr:spastin [Trifolium pratense]
MVGLPYVDNRENILRTLLAKEKVDDGLDFKELATMTEGYSGSDLKNICATAAYRPVRELIQQEILINFFAGTVEEFHIAFYSLVLVQFSRNSRKATPTGRRHRSPQREWIYCSRINPAVVCCGGL